MTRRGWRPRTVRWRVYLVVGGLLLLLLVTAGTTTAVRLHLNTVGHRLTNTLRSAQVAAADLAQAYIDEETGERGYLLTRDPTLLQPYELGQQQTASRTTELRRLFTADPTAMRMLTQVSAAAVTWRTQVIDPELRAFRQGSLTGPQLVATVNRGKTLFDALRARLGELQDRINQQVTAALQDSNATQTTANEVTIWAAIAALLLAAIAVWQLRTSFAVPLNRLVGQVQRVSGGDLDHSVDVSGPQEIVTVGETVEAMRVRILAESTKAADAGRQVARYEEAERIAGRLGDTVIRQLFTTSLALQSAASRYPAAAPLLAHAIRDIDGALRDLRSVIFELTFAPGQQPLGDQLIALVDQLAAGQGVAPEVQLSGGVDGERLQPVAADVMAVVREVLAVVAGGSTIALTADDTVLSLQVTGGLSPDQEIATDGIRHRADRWGGECTIEQSQDAVAVRWQVPITPPAASPAADS